MAGLHTVVGAALSLAAQVGRVAEHGAQRHVCHDLRGAVSYLRAGYHAAAGVEVADDVYQIDKSTREETVTLTYTCGATRDVCVTADSLIALTTDVISKL